MKARIVWVLNRIGKQQMKTLLRSFTLKEAFWFASRKEK
jgi:hypothetical protein